MRLDIHASWAGNPDIVIKVGYKGMPLVLELSEIQFRGKVPQKKKKGRKPPPCVPCPCLCVGSVGAVGVRVLCLCMI